RKIEEEQRDRQWKVDELKRKIEEEQKEKQRKIVQKNIQKQRDKERERDKPMDWKDKYLERKIGKMELKKERIGN
ncbi:MAG: hypothetical protein EZS28_031294, partial [Streblomastix strix]